MSSTSQQPTRVGVLLVHGIGEQRQFEHLEGEARNIISALKLTEGESRGESRTVRVVVNSHPNAAFGADQETWQAWEQAPVMVEVIDTQDDNDESKVTQIRFHQVWWSDLDEPSNLATQIRFWLWGLSLWTLQEPEDPDLPGFKKRMRPPQLDNIEQTNINLGARLRLFWVALVILLILPVLVLLDVVLRRVLGFNNLPRPDILAQYIGDVKLFQQEGRVGKGPLQDLGSKPRVTLRRRMICGLVRMALCEYDRWYVFAHSQGTVLAFNGLMESAQSLPNYLTRELWQEAQSQHLIRPAQGDECLTDQEKLTMSPPFPSWRAKCDILDRKRLFANLEGVLTYGSPLKKFAVLWPHIVPLNNDREAFSANFQWFNIFDPTDPVAGQTQPFQLGDHFPQADPIDIAYKADAFHLISHTKYLAFNPLNPRRLVNTVATWLFTGQKDLPRPRSNQSSRGWPNPTLTKIYGVTRQAMWVVMALLIGFVLGELILIAVLPKLSPQVQNSVDAVVTMTPSWLIWPLVTLYLSAALATVGAFLGGSRWFLGGGVGGVLATSGIALSSSAQQSQFLSWIVRALIEGVCYIGLAAVVVLVVGIVVRIFVRDLHQL